MPTPPPPAAPATPAPHPGMRFGEFVAFVAALMAVNALGIDAMLPALPAMGRDLGIVVENDRQWIIAAYVFGFGAAQLVYGPLADRFGRKPVLLASMSLFAVTSLIAAFATSFAMIIAARAAQGIVAAASRVLAVSIVRDCYSGRTMARVMSLAFMVFLAVPILAPSLGQLILLVTSWHAIFLLLGGFGAFVALWGWLRLPETLARENRRPLSFSGIAATAGEVARNRVSFGYTIGATLLFGGLMGYINSVQQIFEHSFRAPQWFTTIFALTAGFLAVASFLNSRIVERVGMRFVSHSALLVLIAAAALHTLVALLGLETILSFTLLQGLTMGCFGLAVSNFNALAMEPVGHIAGTASSLQGFASTVGGAAIGIAIGQSFDGSTVPLAAGFLLLGLAALLVVLTVERGRLFRTHAAA